MRNKKQAATVMSWGNHFIMVELTGEGRACIPVGLTSYPNAFYLAKFSTRHWKVTHKFA